MAEALYEGWAILHFNDKPPLAGRLRYEQAGDLFQWVLDVPPVPVHRHMGYVAILDPTAINAVIPCEEGDAVTFMESRDV